MTVTRQETTTAPDAARAGETGARRLALALRRIGRYVRALRAFSFPLSAGPVLAAAAIVAPPADWRADVLIASLAGVVLLHAAGNLLNDYFDFRHGTDARRTGDAGRPGRLLVTGRLRPREVLAEAVACLVAAGGAAAWLVL
ncbi:MAG: UbiA family prenyltransferase, partial [Phycisphaerae bacterium]|nr:UbiA family prenyltransferase [Phycisphaerae bacterium]